MNKRGMKISTLATPLMIVCGLLASGASAIAQSSDRHWSCSNQTLSGDYGAAAEGVLIDIPGLPPQTPLRVIGVIHYDGKGNFTETSRSVVNGNLEDVDWTTNIGTYTVNSDCTGTTVLNNPHVPDPLKGFFVVVRRGREVHTMQTTHAISGVQIKIE